MPVLLIALALVHARRALALVHARRALALVHARRALADTGWSTCPVYYGSQYCAGVCTPTLVRYGYECGIQHVPEEGCCQYDAFNVYCLGMYYQCYDQHNYGRRIGDVHPGYTCVNGTCTAP